MTGKGIVLVVLWSVVVSACAARQPSPRGRVGELRGRIVRVEQERGVIAVLAEPDGGEEWLQLKPFTTVRGLAISSAGALQAGQKVYVRYLREPRRDPPEVLSVTVLHYILIPSGRGPASFRLPGF